LVLQCHSISTVGRYETLPPSRRSASRLQQQWGKTCLIILDDLLNTAYSKDVCDIFTKGSHHRYISVILITQNLPHQGKFYRNISLNEKYIVVLKNVRDNKHFSQLARQVLPHYSKGHSDAYLNATDEPHGYLVLDLSQDTNDRHRFGSCIFFEEEPPIFYVDIGNETRKRKFSHRSHAKKGSAKITKSNYIKLRQRPRELH